MGYTTEFAGSIGIKPPLKPEHIAFLKCMKDTRRMARNLDELKYGIQGEFYCGDTTPCGQQHTADIINFNSPPSTQPALWMQWVPTDDGEELEWDGGEKAYNMDDFLVYLLERFFRPLGYVLNGEVIAQGEDVTDRWKITVRHNIVKFTGSIRGDAGQAELHEVLTCDIGQLPTHLQAPGSSGILAEIAARRIKGEPWLLHPYGSYNLEAPPKARKPKVIAPPLKIDTKSIRKIITDHPLNDCQDKGNDVFIMSNSSLCIALLELIKEASHA